ncbi:hypothetical protein ACJ8O1_15785, partial [Serratia sp. CY74308]
LAAAGVKAHRVLDINDAAFISSLGHMDGVISLRCYQKFSAFNSNLLNIFITVIRLCWRGKARNVAA